VQNAVGIDVSTPERHIVAEGFRGWAIVDFGVEGSPPLEVANRVTVVEYPAAGRLVTSTISPDAEGLLDREFFERKKEELVPLTRLDRIWGEYNLRAVTDDEGALVQRSFGFFVGTMAEFRAAERPLPGIGLPELPETPHLPG